MAERAPKVSRRAPTLPPPGPSGRAVAVLLLVLLLGSGLLYTGSLVEFAGAVTPHTAGGSLGHDANGSLWGSALLGENVSDPALFWLRPSLINDEAFLGAGGETPYGPTDPALVNETRYYLALEGLGNASSVPVDLLTPSASGLDPDLSPAAVLIQIPRVAQHSGLSVPFLTDLVNAHIHHPFLGFFGTDWVDVIELDEALLPSLPAADLPA